MRKHLILPVLAALGLATGLEFRGASGASAKSSDSSDGSAVTPKSKRHHPSSSTNGEKASPTPKPKTAPRAESSTDADSDEPPAKKGSTKIRPKATPAPDAEAASSSVKAGKKKAKADSNSSEDEPKAAPAKPVEKTPLPPPAPSPSEKGKTYYASASIPSSEIVAFAEQPPRVQQMIEAALDLAKLNLTYTFGSADPANGGMDCSGAVYYLLREQGFTDVPRDASGQYVWARKHGQFFAVISRKPGGFEFSDLLPGDLLFWNGTYNDNAERDPPVTHTMIYLGVQRHRGVPIMWGSSDGRSFDGKSRWGVSLFDFTMPKSEGPYASKALFLGYARIPGLRSGSLAIGHSQ